MAFRRFCLCPTKRNMFCIMGLAHTYIGVYVYVCETKTSQNEARHTDLVHAISCDAMCACHARGRQRVLWDFMNHAKESGFLSCMKW